MRFQHLKSEGAGKHELGAFVSPSPHKNGSNYEIMGTHEPAIAEDLEQHLESICRKYAIPYHDLDGNENLPTITMANLFQDATKIIEGNNRHQAIMRTMESLLWNLPHVQPELIKKWAWDRNLNLCVPPLDQTEFNKQWHGATEFISKKVKERGPKQSIDPNAGVDEDLTDAGLLIKIGTSRSKRLFCDEYKMPFAQVLVKDHYEVIALNSDKFKRFVAKEFYEEHGRTPGIEAQNRAIQILIGKADWDNPSIPLHLRVCRPNNNSPIYYDLTNPLWQQVEIRKGEPYKIISAEESPVLFNRFGQVAQVEPEKENCQDILDAFMALTNIKNVKDILLTKVYMITAFVPGIAHPIYCPFGGAGAGKTLLQTMIKKIVDPANLDLLTIPSDKSEFLQQIDHNHMTLYDNLKEKRVPKWLPQDICSAVTGGGNSKRVLFTVDDDFARKYKRCLGFNGINVAMTEPDVASRSIIIKLETIGRESNRTESEILAEFDVLRPRLLGFIFNTIANAMNIIDSIKLTDLPRLADFGIWGEGVARVLGYKEREFLDAYYENIGKQDAEAVENDFVGETVLKLRDDLESEGRTIWVDPIRKLLNELNKIAEDNNIDMKSKDWPKIPTQLSRILNELRNSLLAMGIEIKIEKLKAERKITDEIDKDFQGNNIVHTYKRDTTLVTIRLRNTIQKQSGSSIPTSPQAQALNGAQKKAETRDVEYGWEASHNPQSNIQSPEKCESQAQKDSFGFVGR